MWSIARRGATEIACAAALAAAAASAASGPADVVPVLRGFHPDLDGRVIAAGGQALIVDRQQLDMVRVGQRLIIEDFPISLTEAVDLDLVRADVDALGADHRVVGADGIEREVGVPQVGLFGGSVLGEPGSSVFLSVSDHGAYGWIDFGRGRFIVTTGRPTDPHAPAVFDTGSPEFAAIAWKPFSCGADELAGAVAEGAAAGELPEGLPNCKRVEIAIDTDEAYRDLFPSAAAAQAYIQTLVGATNQIYRTESSVELQVVFTRLWESNDPWAGSSTSDRLNEFRTHWMNSMGSQVRDLAHLLSGESLGGGIAYLTAVCSTSIGYGVSANLDGFFPTPVQNNHAQNWDLVVFAHELGHNFGCEHTHSLSPPYDTCASGGCSNASTIGTIMSYCHLCSGGLANIRLVFAPGNLTQISAHVGSRTCLSVGLCQGGSGACVQGAGPSDQTFDAAGGAFDVAVAGNSATCTWTVSDVSPPDADWIEFGAPAVSGAAGAVRCLVLPNPGTAQRTASFSIGGKPVTVRQLGTSAAPCVLNVSGTALSVPAAAGASLVSVGASSVSCTWTASSLSNWLTVSPTSGSGSGDVLVSYQANAGSTLRTGVITVAGRNVTVTQASGGSCQIGLATTSTTLGSAVSSGTVAVTAGSSCQWSTSSSVPWLAVGPADGAGDGTVHFAAARNGSASSRTGVIRIGGRAFSVTQLPGSGCGFALSTSSASVGDAAGSRSVTLSASASAACLWAATSSASWLTVEPTSGAGAGSVTVRYQANSSSSERSGTVTIAGQTFTVTQGGSAPCTFALESSSTSAGSGAWSGSVALTASGPGCAWTASSGASWLTVSPASGSGSASIALAAVANPTTAPRTGTATIAGRIFTVVQDAGSASVGIAGWATHGDQSNALNSSMMVPVPAGATSLASLAFTVNFDALEKSYRSEFVIGIQVPGSSTAFMHVRPSSTGSPGNHTGAGSSATHLLAGGAFPIPAGTSSLRLFVFETYDDAGQDSRVNSGTVTPTFGFGGCAFTLSAASASAGASGWTGTVGVNASATSCAWTASSSAPWLSVNPAGGTGNGTVTLACGANVGTSSRSGTATIAGRTYTVTQAGASPCSFSLSSSAGTAGAAAWSGTVVVTSSAPNCAWTASSSASWITVSPAGGTGGGTVTVSCPANPGATSRTGTVTIAGIPYVVTQAAIVPAVNIAGWVTYGGPSNASNSSTLVTVPSGATSLAALDYTVNFDTLGGSYRSEFVIGIEVPGSATAYLHLRPTTAGSSGNYSGSGSSSGTLYAGAPFAIPSGTTALRLFVFELYDDAGQDARVNSGTVTPSFGFGSCSYALSTSSASAGSSAWTGTVGVTASSSTCAWTASSSASWLSVSPSAGTGSGSVTVSCPANPSAASRSGTVSIAGRVYTVTQAAAPPCTFALSGSSASAGSAAWSGSVALTASASSCAWTASSAESWLTVSPAAGTGSGSVTISCPANATGVLRTGTVTIAGRTFTVTQAAAGSSISMAGWASHGLRGNSSNTSTLVSVPSGATSLESLAYTVNFDALGGSYRSEFMIGVEIPGSSTAYLWVKPSALTSPGNHSGSGSSSTNLAGGGTFAIPSGTPSLRVTVFDTIDDAGQDARVNSGTVTLAFGFGACTYTLSGSSASPGAAAWSGTVSLTASASNCAWTASSSASWLTVSPSSGTGSRALALSCPANPSTSPRTGTVTIAGRTFTVAQAASAPCTYSLSSSSVSAGAAAWSGSVGVSASAASCAWTASSSASWLTVSPTSATGSGSVTVSCAANSTGAERSGTATIAGRTFTVTQSASSPSTNIAGWAAHGGISSSANSSTTVPVPAGATRLASLAFTVSFETLGSSYRSEFLIRVEVPGSADRFLTVRPTATASPGAFSGSGSSATVLFGGGAFDIPSGTPSLKLFVYESYDDAGQDARVISGNVTLGFASGTAQVSVPGVHMGPTGGIGRFSVAPASAAQEWSAAASVTWIEVLQGSGVGNGEVSFRCARNPTAAPRLGMISVAGQSVAVSQEAGTPCPADLSGDGAVSGADLSAMLMRWGAQGPSLAEDIDGDGAVTGADLQALFSAWGVCPN